MTPELKAKWLDALESGDYKQASGYLQTNGGFCCLGVLADIIDPNGWRDGGWRWVWGTESKISFLPDAILDTSIQRLLARTNDKATDFGPSIELIKEML